MAQIIRQEAINTLVTGAKPQQTFWQNLMDSIVFKSDDLKSLFLQYATQLEAEAGTNNDKIMTALRVGQAIQKLGIDVIKANVNADGDNLFKLRALIKNLEDWKNVLTTDDTDTIINTIKDITDAFNGLPEGVGTLLTELNKKELLANKKTSISVIPTDTNYLSEKAVKTELDKINNKLLAVGHWNGISKSIDSFTCYYDNTKIITETGNETYVITISHNIGVPNYVVISPNYNSSSDYIYYHVRYCSNNSFAVNIFNKDGSSNSKNVDFAFLIFKI